MTIAIRFGCGLVLAASLLAVSAATARTSDPAPAPAPVSPEAEGVAQVVTAAQVAAWGRAHQDAGALIMAARILAEVPVRAAPAGDASPPILTPAALLDEAAALSMGDQAALDAIAYLRAQNPGDADPATSGVRGVRSSPFGQGPIFMVRQIRARETWGFDVEARGGEVLRVAAIGDGDTNIDMSVRDADGAVVCRDGFGDHYPVCTVARARAGKMRIDIVNRGAIWTKVQILSN